jgi:hypothetical protein
VNDVLDIYLTIINFFLFQREKFNFKISALEVGDKYIFFSLKLLKRCLFFVC